MAESHVVSGFVAKRSELVGQIEKLQDEIASISALMDCIDGSMKEYRKRNASGAVYDDPRVAVEAGCFDGVGA